MRLNRFRLKVSLLGSFSPFIASNRYNIKGLRAFTTKFEVYNPYDKSLVASHTSSLKKDSKHEDADKIVLKSRNAQKIWKNKSLSERIDVISKFVEYFKINKEAIATDITRQMGKPFQHSLGEINGLEERSKAMMELSTRALASKTIESSDEFIRVVHKEPKGIALTLAPWNYPLLTAVNSVVPALLAGNSILLSHGPTCFLSSQVFSAAIHEVVTISCPADSETLKHLIIPFVVDWEDLPLLISKVDAVSFTGSTLKGKEIQAMCSQASQDKFLSPVLELGGCDAAYVSNLISDEQLNSAVDTVIDAAFFNAGQGCCSIERVYVHEDIYDNFQMKIKSLPSNLYELADPKKPTTSMGPLCKTEHLKDLNLLIEEAQLEGCEIIKVGENGGESIESDFFTPTIVFKRNLNWNSSCEVFGPILFVFKVSSEEQAIEEINKSSYGLTSTVFTNDIDCAQRIASQLEVGTVFMNRADYLDPYLPWQGRKLTGTGCSLGEEGFNNFVNLKNMHFKLK